ncbi:hypothetical protein CWI38_0097p0040 [Hamiltosporidium tvaerminnensis]|uniref:Uncharacterized protein n=2 Tax=Hamiltosporidium TaxID=1176354 RepID=A0A4Q9LH98_9MICR|nr:hypothetical protein CWI36_0267p0020 [Hamiltosporidium magnivora]TBU20281.1 hypothetical protein CWI38_0097p0040 [Hamiltosporidium tvaerminnensis]
MANRRLTNIFFYYLIGYGNAAFLPESESFLYEDQDNKALRAGNLNRDNNSQESYEYIRQSNVSENHLLSIPSTSSNRFQPYYKPHKSQENGVYGSENAFFNNQPENFPVTLHPGQSEPQYNIPGNLFPGIYFESYGVSSSNQNETYGYVSNPMTVTQVHTFTYQEQQSTSPLIYQNLTNKQNQWNFIESESTGFTSDVVTGLNSAILHPGIPECQYITSDAKLFNRPNKISAAKSISETQNTGDTEKVWNEMINSKQTSIATADNTDLLSECTLEDKKIMTSFKFRNYFVEFSMTRFKNIDSAVFIKLKHMQEEYRLIREFFDIDANISSNNKKKIIARIVDSCFENIDFFKKSENETQIKLYISYIRWDIERIFQNIFLEDDISNLNTEFYVKNNLSTSKELERIFLKEIKKLENSNIDITYLSNLCTLFVNFEKSYDDVNLNKMWESLSITTLPEVLLKLKNCMEENMFYEICRFLDLYQHNLENHIKKHHRISTIFILDVLHIHIDRIADIKFIHKESQNNFFDSKFTVSYNIYRVGKIFEELLKNLHNNEMRAYCYGMLNVSRFFFWVYSFRKKHGTLLFLQISCLIGMVLDIEFEFNQTKIKEFVVFILFIMKKTQHQQPEFYNDKVQYFLEINASIIDNIINFNIKKIREYDVSVRRNPHPNKRVNIFHTYFSYQAILGNITPNKDEIFKKLYTSQLYLIAVLGNKYTMHLHKQDHIFDGHTDLYKKINKFYTRQ